MVQGPIGDFLTNIDSKVWAYIGVGIGIAITFAPILLLIFLLQNSEYLKKIIYC